MLSWIQSLFAQPAQQQVQVIEHKEPTFEERLQRIAARSPVRGKTDTDVAELVADIDAVLSILESAIRMLGTDDLDQRAKRLRTNLKSKRTRALKVVA